MTPEGAVNQEIATALMTFKICVLPMPKDLWRLKTSPWLLVDSSFHTGVAWRINTGVASYGRRKVRFGIPGQPDWLGMIWGRAGILAQPALIFTIEAKSGHGKESPNQRAYGSLAREIGALHGICRSYDDACALLKSWQIRRPA